MESNPTMELLAIRRRTLQYLEQQRAELGILTPYHIVREIEQTKREIERLMHYSYIYRLEREIAAHERPKPSPGALILVSPEAVEPEQQLLRQGAFDAIDYHRVALRHCWLIGTTGKIGALAAAEWLAGYCRARDIQAHVWQVQDASSLAETYRLIQLLYATEIRESGLRDYEVVADITGATKSMSIGMMLACQGRSAVQYMVRADNQMSIPILLDLTLPAWGPDDAGSAV